MIHAIEMGDDAIIRISINGELGKPEIDSLLKDFKPFVAASTPASPLKAMLNAENLGKLSSAARHAITELNRDARVGHIALFGANRQMRVFINFLLKATERDNIHLCDTQKEALAWLKAR